MSKDPKDPAPPVVDVKLQAFTQVAAAVAPLSKADQYAVLNAAAHYCGFTIKLDVAGGSERL